MSTGADPFRWVPLHDAATAFPGVLWWDARRRERGGRVIRACREERERLGSWEFPEGEPALERLGAE